MTKAESNATLRSSPAAGGTLRSTSPDLSKSKGLVFFEYVLLALCLCVIAIRATFTEGPNAQTAGQSVNISDSVYSLSISGLLISAFVLWLIAGLCGRKFSYRFTAMEIGLGLFCIAAVVAGLAAPNKRAAITNSVMIVAPVLMAVLLVQILDSFSKIKLVLVVVASLGVVNAFQSAEQLFVSNQELIDEYKKSPQTMLEQLGIQSGSYEQMLFEHRLYSKGVRGFFTTGNSAGSFSLLAVFAAAALFIEKLKLAAGRRSGANGTAGRLIACGLVVAVILFGLVITKSKGAIGSGLIAAAMFAGYLLFGDWLRAHRKAVSIFCLLLVLAGGCTVVFYGLTYDRLPGGRSMTFRWQYWQASVKMYADHYLTGVGPGNFNHFYPRYKPAVALETVSDPHNFLLSILTQYGPLGLAGFLALVFVPLRRTVFPGITPIPSESDYSEPAFNKLAAIFMVVIAFVLLLVRPAIIPTGGDTLDVKIYLIFVLYAVPAAAFVGGFWLLTIRRQITNNELQTTTTDTAAALFYGVAGVLIHNLIDFAIFEPPVFTAFWAVMACLIALNLNKKSQPHAAYSVPRTACSIVIAAGAAIIWAYLNYTLVPVVKAETKIKEAIQPVTTGEYSNKLLAQAAKDDPLDPRPMNLRGRLLLQLYEQTGNNRFGTEPPALLQQAADCFDEAIDRDKADYRNYQKLSTIYTLLAESSAGEKKTAWLDMAFSEMSLAVEHYPGSETLHLELAKIAEQLGKNKFAAEHYQTAIDIEDNYRSFFKREYPGTEPFDRLGKDNYKFAKEHLKKFSH